MRLLVGLGNPGPEYAKTRHNAGFLLADHYARAHGIAADNAQWRSQFHGLAVAGRAAGEKVLLLKPMTYMNRSGLAVGEAATFYKIEPEQVMVLVDDIALDAGVIRLRAGGSAGGHNGLKDIEKLLGTRDYPRLRIGIDPPGRSKQVDYVLGQFTSEQLDLLDPALDRGVRALDAWITDGIDKAMSVYNATG